MSSPAASAREKRVKTQGGAYCKRPEHLPRNAPRPRYAYLAQHMLILSWAIVLKAMWSLKPRQLPDGDWVLQASITQITQATTPIMAFIYGAPAAQAMARRTVGNALVSLRARGFIERFDRERSINSPFGTIWRVRRLERVKALIDADPAIGKVTTLSGKKAFYTFAKGRRPGGPEELIDWQIDHVLAENTPAAHTPALPIALDEPAPKIATPHRVTVEEQLIEDVGIVHKAILDAHANAEPEQAAALLELARNVDATIPAASVAMLIHELGMKYLETARKKSPHGIIPNWTVGWFRNDLPGAVHHWQRQRDAAQRATGTRA